MSHQINKLDKVVATEKTWHGLEQIVEAITFENSGLNWEVEKRELFVPCDGTVCPVDGWQAIVRKDTHTVLNIPKKTYAIISNNRVWEALQEALVGVNYKVVSTGSLQNCRKVFISVAIEDKQDYVVNGDKFRNYISFITSHDGTLAFTAQDVSLRVVCFNTMTASLAQGGGSVDLKVYHSKNNEFKIREMEKTLEDLFIKREEFYKSVEYLMNKPVSLDKANQILTGFVGNGDELSTRAENQAQELVGLFQNGLGNNGQTYADLLNSVTQYFTHSVSDNKQKLFVSNEIGSAGQKKVEFFDLLMNDAELNQLAARGDALLKARQQAVVVA
jgi:phage/plasmid-like protein (TIGR03299 family)